MFEGNFSDEGLIGYPACPNDLRIPCPRQAMPANAQQYSGPRSGSGLSNELCGAVWRGDGQHVAAVDQRELRAG